MKHSDLPRIDDLRAWLRTLPDVLLFVEADTSRIVDVNRVAPAFGWSRYELLGMALDRLVPDLTLDEGPVETSLVRRDETRTPVEVRTQSVIGQAGYRLVIVREIGERRATAAAIARLDAELLDANRFLDAVVENIPDMIFVKRASDHMFIRFNRAGEELLGWSRDELLGKTDHDFYPKEEADFFHLKDRETFERRELVDIPEEPITTRSRGQRWLHTKKVPVYDGQGRALYLLGISEDITDRKAAEERAHALERELAAVVLHARDAIVTWTADGTVTSANPAAEALYGIVVTELVGTDVARLVPDAVAARFAKAWRRVVEGEVLPVAEVVRLRGYYEIEVEESLFRIPGPKGIRVASIARDVSEIGRLRRATEILVGPERHGVDPPRASRMQRLLDSVEVVAQDPIATVLLLGETGVGKSWLARRIHARSPRAGRPFLEVNCASLGPALVESELFGHERGAFTGAVAQKRGIVEAADGGTLFLDEVGELPVAVQAQLLTFLDAHAFRRVGGSRALTADVRIVAATNRDLDAEIAAGRFRADLYYRLRVFPIELPPLRDRQAEIPDLARSILGDLARRTGRSEIGLTPAAVAALVRYPWPGNVRELRNALERAAILSRGEPITTEHLPLEPPRRGPSSSRLEDVERAHILAVLDQVGGNRTQAAEILGIGRSTLKRKLAELKLGA